MCIFCRCLSCPEDRKLVWVPRLRSSQQWPTTRQLNAKRLYGTKRKNVIRKYQNKLWVEFFTALFMKINMFRGMLPCWLLICYLRFGGYFRLHIQAMRGIVCWTTNHRSWLPAETLAKSVDVPCPSPYDWGNHEKPQGRRKVLVTFRRVELAAFLWTSSTGLLMSSRLRTMPRVTSVSPPSPQMPSKFLAELGGSPQQITSHRYNRLVVGCNP